MNPVPLEEGKRYAITGQSGETPITWHGSLFVGEVLFGWPESELVEREDDQATIAFRVDGVADLLVLRWTDIDSIAEE